MKLQYIHNFWHFFCQTFEVVSCTVHKFANVFMSILTVHYNTMKSTIEFFVGLWGNISYAVLVFSEVMTCVVHGVIEFLIELWNCFYSFLTFLWKLSILMYHLVSVVFTALENLVSLVWTGSVGTVSVMSTSVDHLKRSWTTTWYKGEAFLSRLFLLVVGGFETIGSVFIEMVLATFNLLLYLLFGIPRSILYTCDFLIALIRNTCNQLGSKLYSLSKESFLGLFMCVFLLTIFFNSVQILTFLDAQGMTFPFFRSRQTRQRNQPPFRYNNNPNNNMGGAYNFEFSDNEPMDDEEDLEDDDEDDRTTVTSRRTPSVTSSIRDSETESFSTSSISSEETSEGEVIEVQLPRAGTSNRTEQPGSRSPTPVLTKPVDSESMEKEIERERDKRKCVVCQDQLKTVLILPCRHMCLCVPCAERIVQILPTYRRLCPLCRVRIEKVMNVYV